MFDISETELHKYTVKISYEGGQKHLGSGFFVSPRLILTCAHVCLKYIPLRYIRGGQFIVKCFVTVIASVT